MRFFRELKENISLILNRVSEILRILKDDQLKKTFEKPSLTIARHVLGSIDLADIHNPDDVPEENYDEYCAKLSTVHSLIEKELKYLIKLQHDFWFTKSENWEQTMFGRGTSNGIQLVLDRFELLRNKYLEKINIEKEPSIGSREDIMKKLHISPVDTMPDNID